MLEMIAEYTKEDFSKSLAIYYCGSEQCQPSHAFGPAVRNHYLMHFVLKGKGKFSVGEKLYEVLPGEAFLIIPGVSTYYIADKEEPWEYAWVAFGGCEAEAILKKCGLSANSPIYHGANQKELIKTIMEMLEQYLLSGQNEYTLLGHLYFLFSYMKQKESIPEENYRAVYLNRALDYINHNYGYDIKIADIAKYVGIDRTYLYKIFMEQKEVSPQQYLISFRLANAKNMLAHTTMNVTEVAYSCGFKDAPSFCKHFKRAAGTTPAEYRKNSRY